MKTNLILFDFCGTLVNLQTADNFINFIRQNENNKNMNLKEYLRKILIKTGIMKVFKKIRIINFNKRIILWQIKNFDYDKLDQYAKRYYFEIVKPAFINQTILEMKKYKKEGNKIYVISGGYDIYLKYFIKEFELDKLICTKILFKNNKCLGQFKGKDCTGENKIKEVNKLFIDNANTIAYSDCITDLPLLKWAKKGIVVSKKYPTNWAKNYGLGELIWNS
jgi:HAD superfamily hydrolase (TIGR01490 family)